MSVNKRQGVAVTADGRDAATCMVATLSHAPKLKSAGLTLVDALGHPDTVRSRILDRDVYAYWDTIGTINHDSLDGFIALLRANDLLREPPGGMDAKQLDAAMQSRVWRSGLKYGELFTTKIVRKPPPAIWSSRTT